MFDNQYFSMVQNCCPFFYFKLTNILIYAAFCWAFNNSQLWLATYSFQRLRQGPLLSTQCLINGVAHHAPGDMNNVDAATGHYEASSCAALRFIERRGCDLEANVPFVQRQEDDMPFRRVSVLYTGFLSTKAQT
jgi:hypothetical protein